LYKAIREAVPMAWSFGKELRDSRSPAPKAQPNSGCRAFDEREIIGAVFSKPPDGSKVFERIEEALREIAEAVEESAEGGDIPRPGMGLMLPPAPHAARASRNALS
jgi:hypothetical protein